MYFIIYKTVNNINNKYYIGAHKTNLIDDGYLGSGIALKRAIQKYGVSSFSRTILHIFDNKHDMFEKERELVTEDIVRDRMSYNLKIGGSANFYFINNNGLNHKNNQHLIHAQRLLTDKEYAKKFQIKMKNIYENSSLKKRNQNCSGKNNLNFGKKWINNGIEDKMINPIDYDQFAKLGYTWGKRFRPRKKRK